MIKLIAHYIKRSYVHLYRFKNAVLDDLSFLVKIIKYQLTTFKPIAGLEKNEYYLVVARYNESLDWLGQIDIPYVVYNKGESNIDQNLNVIDLPNIGRETHTYLHYILTNYGYFPDNTIFCQGNPFDHAPNFLNDLQKREHFLDVQPLNLYGLPKYHPNLKKYPSFHTGVPEESLVAKHGINYKGINYYVERINGSMNIIEPETYMDVHLSNYQLAKKLKNKLLPHLLQETGIKDKTSIYASYAAMFSVNCKNIMLRDYKTYKKCMNFNLKHKESGPYFIERLWLELFNYKPQED